MPLLDRDNVGLITVFEYVTSCKKDNNGGRTDAKPWLPVSVCIANTHLLFNPRRGDIKLAQLAILLSEIDDWASKCMPQYDPRHTQYCPVILCGDFNSVPHSPLYDLITTGYLEYTGLQAKEISGQERNEWARPSRMLKNQIVPEDAGITYHCQKTKKVEYRIENFKRNMKQRAVICKYCENVRNVNSIQQKPNLKAQLKTMEKDDKSEEPADSGPSGTGSDDCLIIEPDTGSDISDSVIIKQVGEKLNAKDEDSCCFHNKNFKDDDFADLFRYSTGCFMHNLSLKSVYDSYVTDRSNKFYNYPYVTSNHSKANDMVDFMFYSEEKQWNMWKTEKQRLAEIKRQANPAIKCCSRLSLLTDAEMYELGGLPNDIISSDHHMIMAKFILRNIQMSSREIKQHQEAARKGKVEKTNKRYDWKRPNHKKNFWKRKHRNN